VARQISQLEIEKQALKKEKDAASKTRLQNLEKELAALNEKSQGLRAHWEQEKAIIEKIRGVKARIEETKAEAERAERAADFGAAAELKYGRLTQLEKELNEQTQKLVELQSDRKMLKEEVDEDDIAEIVSRWTGVPVSRMLESEMQKLLRMEDRLHERVIGQDEAIGAVANAVRRGRAGLSDPNRPVGSFIFLGPTGVGKTELARALAEFLFDDEQAMVRLDMSEYMEKHTVSRLVGAPPGYVGYDEGGQLTEAVRRRPYSVVLFDEIEKAHPDVFNVLLQILEDGRLTDGQGRTVDFKNTIVVMTSNIGSHLIQELGPDGAGTREAVMEALRQNFRPEFLNRVDDVIIFHSLAREQLRGIVEIQLGGLRKRLADRNLQLEVTDAAKDRLAEEGYDPVYGARPLKRTIQRLLQDPLAMRILEGEFREDDTIKVDAKGNELRLTRLPGPTAIPAETETASA
jgi:ATP-dependent Clp protease ATP-binding subunit ClpB